jgi:hypothetical protein
LNFRRRCLLILPVALACAAALDCAAALAESDDLDRLMPLLAARQHGATAFVEQQFLSVLERPLESWGELIYDAPDRLEKRTVKPRAEILVLQGDELTAQRGSHRRVLNLHDYPQVRPFVESIRATLAGDRSALERVFSLDFSGSLERWSLLLVPKDPKLAKTVARIKIDGARDNLLSVEIRQADGDRSLMTLRPDAAP